MSQFQRLVGWDAGKFGGLEAVKNIFSNLIAFQHPNLLASWLHNLPAFQLLEY